MKNSYRIFSAIFLAVLMFTAAAAAAHAQKLGGEWKLVEARQNGRKVYLGRQIKTNVIFGEGNRMSGNAGCNRYSTTYTLRGRNRISFEPIIATKMACADNNFMKQESTFFSIMETVVRHRVREDYLIFSDAEERNVLRFARVSKLKP